MDYYEQERIKQQKFDRQFKAAQQRYDNQLPPDYEDGPEFEDYPSEYRGWKCLECHEIYLASEYDDEPTKCQCCFECADEYPDPHPGFEEYIDYNGFNQYQNDAEAEAALDAMDW